MSASSKPTIPLENENSYINDDESDDDDDEWITAEIAEVIRKEDEEDEDDEEDWIPDAVKAKMKRQKAERVAIGEAPPPVEDQTSEKTGTASPYTEEEENVIENMGGRTSSRSKREPGYLGDSTLEEIATDYSVPVCYLADVLYIWGVPAPINIHDRLGDLVTGEQAFAILEAVNSLDVSALHDRYSNQSLFNLCHYWDIEIADAFEMAIKEGWSLPFGVHSVLRIEQEGELIRVLGGYSP